MGKGGVAGSAEDATGGRTSRPLDVGRVLVLAPVEAMGASPGVGEAALARADAAAESFEGAAMPVSDDAEDGNGEAAAWFAVSTGAVAEGAMDDAVLRVIKVS